MISYVRVKKNIIKILYKTNITKERSKLSGGLKNKIYVNKPQQPFS